MLEKSQGHYSTNFLTFIYSVPPISKMKMNLSFRGKDWGAVSAKKVINKKEKAAPANWEVVGEGRPSCGCQATQVNRGSGRIMATNYSANQVSTLFHFFNV